MSDVAGWLDAYARAWRDKDAEGAARLFTADATYRSHPLAEAHQGTAAIRAYWERATGTQNDLDLRFGAPVAQGDRVAVEWWATMRDTEWGPPESRAGGQTLPGRLVLRFAADGRCADLREYYNPRFGERRSPPPGGR